MVANCTFNLENLPRPLVDLEIPGYESHRGKVRRNFSIDDKRLLLVATDAVSAHDVVMNEGIPGKGTILTQMSLFWNAKLHELLGSESFRYHLISSTPISYSLKFRRAITMVDDTVVPVNLTGRSMLVKRVKILPIENIVRGYLAGSGLKEYNKSQTVCGIALPEGLLESDKLPEPLWTPSTKAPDGEHDINITEGEAVEVVMCWLKDLDLNYDPAMVIAKLKRLSLLLYTTAADYALSRGIIIADTKFELGLDEAGNLVLADEVLTPDSSRFWDAEAYEPGKTQASFDKQLLRDYLDLLVKYGLWDKQAPAPPIPPQIIAATTQMYLTAFWRLTSVDLTAIAAKI
jgi:phosphoribosylaminoimidazole-succinocarboxamide synthase